MNTSSYFRQDHGSASSGPWAGGMTMNQGYSGSTRIHRDIDRKWVAGVIAGLAGHLGWSLAAMRVVAIVLLCTPMMPAVVLLYVVAAVILPPARTLAVPMPHAAPPPPPPGATSAPNWSATAPPAHAQAGDLRQQLRELEDRLRAMEAYLTSPQYEIDRQLRKRGD